MDIAAQFATAVWIADSKYAAPLMVSKTVASYSLPSPWPSPDTGGANGAGRVQ